MKINLFKTKTNFKKKRIGPNANFYWKVIVLVTFLLVLASFIFDYYMYTKVKGESFSRTESINQKQPIEKQRLENVLEYFSSREKQSNAILNSTSPVADPSL